MEISSDYLAYLSHSTRSTDGRIWNPIHFVRNIDVNDFKKRLLKFEHILYYIDEEIKQY